MPDSNALIKANPLLPAEDYDALRGEGFHSVEELGSNNWTEYNNSDPGITVLEAVCYAITDLAYRTGFDVKDLLTPETLTEDTWKNIFYTARQILHNNPLTINDYRKLIIDTKGVRNAWLEPSKDYEVPVWVNYNYFERKADLGCGCEDNEMVDCYGKLQLQPAETKELDDWKQKRHTEIGEATTKNNATIQEMQTSVTKLTTQLENETDPLTKSNLQLQIDKLNKKINKLTEVNRALADEGLLITQMKFTPSKIVELEGLYNVMVEYEEDVLDEGQREEVRQKIVNKLYSHRNLCEDFLSVNAVEYLDFGIGASISIEEYADPDAVLAQIFFAIYKYFTPSVRFYTIDQMLAKGYQVDEIFEGPPLRHGFIDTAELEKTDLFRDIRLSDIINDMVLAMSIDGRVINEISGIKGIKAITYMHLPLKDPDGNTTGNENYFNEWIKYLTEERKIARIQPSMSSIIFCKEHDVITYYTGREDDRRPDRMLKMFRDLKKQERRYKLEGQENDFKVPAGENMELQDYYPVTYSLPMYYGVSERAGLPLDASEKRKTQALQLKGYMLFFEQLLADYLVQLDHLRDLFSFDYSQKKTYFTRALTEIVDLQALIIDHANRGDDHFDQILDDFTHVLHNLVETPTTFYRRRNHFLNHMLARFSENLEEYERISRWLTPWHVDERLINDKIRILTNGNYYKISTERAKAYNYSLQQVWNTENVSGAEVRMSRLLGFANADRRTLSPDFIVIEAVMITDDKTKAQVQKKNKKGQPLNIIKVMDPWNSDKVILTSVEVIDGCCVESLINDILEHADERHNFQFHDELKQRSRKAASLVGSFWFDLWDGPDPDNAVLLAKSEKFETKAERNHAFETLQKIMKDINGNEGLHLLEHLLLRPKLDTVYDEVGALIPVSFPEICLDPCDIGRGIDDRITPPGYKKKITRIPADKCFDNMPWVLEYLRLTPNSNPKKYESLLFLKTFGNGDAPVMLTFKRYEALAKRVRDIAEFGSERINYTISDNRDDIDDNDETNVRYSFTIHGDKGVMLAQSPYVFKQRKKETDPPVDNDIEEEIKNLMAYLEFELDLYCDPDPCDNNEDPFSFRCTVVLPCWPKRLRDGTFRNFVEKTIQSEAPAHVDVSIKWLGIVEMKRFEKVYYDWLTEMAQTEMPSYDIVNPLVDTLNTLVPCGCCHDDCHDSGNADDPKNNPTG